MAAGAAVLASSTTGVIPEASTTVDPAKYSTMREALSQVSAPTIEQPQWLKDQLAAEAAVVAAAQAAAAGAKRSSNTISVTYDVSTRGVVSASVSEFKLQANQTLNDSRGWVRMNVRFVEVASGGQFNLILATADEVGAVPGCGAEYSCRSGRSVLINQDRWMGATPSWNNAGGSLRDYRHMVVNHEVGHWLGHGHSSCGGAGQPAPVMQQQSIDLQGCGFNPWPLASELNSNQLGI
ncbi:MAG: DUF3152 domain-containing protein [Patescibacteria group bacterium]